MVNIWILVADASRARIFQTHASDSALQEIITLTNPAGRLHEGDITSDRPGRDANRSAGSHGFGTGNEAKSTEADRFAAEVCQRLSQARTEDAFDKLFIIAAPAFLGMLRQHMSKQVQEKVREEIAKDLTTAKDSQIRAQLPEHM